MDLKIEGKKIDQALYAQKEKWLVDLRNIDERLHSIDDMIQKAAAFGDLSENNEYQDAVNMKQLLMREKVSIEGKISAYDSKYQTYVTGENSRGSLATVGSVVRIFMKEVGKGFIVKLVPPKSDAPGDMAISTSSPLGKAILNKQAGDTTIVVTERKNWTCEIKEVY